jgi:hypothetical protein
MGPHGLVSQDFHADLADWHHSYQFQQYISMGINGFQQYLYGNQWWIAKDAWNGLCTNYFVT